VASFFPPPPSAMSSVPRYQLGMFADAIYIGNRLAGRCRNVCFREDNSIDRRSGFGRSETAGCNRPADGRLVTHTSPSSPSGIGQEKAAALCEPDDYSCSFIFRRKTL
jgi:hypothetical protein